MRLGILSDIHGNLPALEEALAVGADAGVAEWICLGDVIDGGRWNNECVRLIRDRGIAMVLGNHDVIYRDGIADDVVDHFHTLSMERSWHGWFCTHISPRRLRVSKVADRYEAANVFDECDHAMILVGHAHITGAWSPGRSAGEAVERSLPLDTDCHLPADERHLVSVGSLGYSRDGDPALRFGVWDDERRVLRVVRIGARSVLDA